MISWNSLHDLDLQERQIISDWQTLLNGHINNHQGFIMNIEFIMNLDYMKIFFPKLCSLLHFLLESLDKTFSFIHLISYLLYFGNSNPKPLGIISSLLFSCCWESKWWCSQFFWPRSDPIRFSPRILNAMWNDAKMGKSVEAAWYSSFLVGLRVGPAPWVVGQPCSCLFRSSCFSSSFN